MSRQLYEEIEDVNGTLIELFEKYHAGLPREDRVQMVQDVRDLLSVAMQTAEHDAEGDAEDGILTQIQELDHALEQALNAPDNEMIGLLESAAVMSKDLVDRVGYYMGGKRTHRGKTHRGKTHRKRTHRGKTHRKRNIKRTHRNRK
jgi:hypothetical protein